ncbi:hypothetical protein KFK09_010026 [Dendrobium nobile]|uniref:RHOMBOID-like protein n=1 Tax=Dendrobium nobile TaxID=94219 RepID=A0A8T3BJ10_DENNO|nr:hypothetical protein KFK09_010026 [Dendrobium nobile]
MAGEDPESGGAGERAGGKRGEEMVLPQYFYDVPDVEERERTAWIVPLIVIANVVVLMVVMFVNNCPVHGGGDGGSRSCFAGFLRRFSFQPIRENPLLGPSSITLEKLGALQWEKTVHQHQWWRLLASIWLHAGVIHLLLDILSLIFIGIRLEQQFGFVRIGTIYLISGIAGNVLSSLFITKGISVGSSGALFGLLGAMLSELITNWSIYSNRAAAISTLLLIVAVNLVIGILPLVNNFAHIGGFIAGFLLGFVLLIRPQFGWTERQSLPHCQPTSKYKLYQLVLWVIGITFLLVGFVVSLVMLFKGVNGSEGCRWCRYMNCVPTSKWSCGN